MRGDEQRRRADGVGVVEDVTVMEKQRGVDAGVGQAGAELGQASVDGGPPDGRMDESTNLRIGKSANLQVGECYLAMTG